MLRKMVISLILSLGLTLVAVTAVFADVIGPVQ